MGNFLINEKPRRKSIRLKGYDYSRCGAYFITIVTQNRTNFFGDIQNNELFLNPAGVITGKWWNEIANKYQEIELDEFVIMPNYIHGIIVIDIDKSSNLDFLPQVGDDNQTSLPRVIQWFKTMTTNSYIRGGVSESSWPRF